MNMKKLTTLLLSAGLLFSMAACSSSKIDDDALTLLETGMNHFEKMESASYNASMDVIVMHLLHSKADILRKIIN